MARTPKKLAVGTISNTSLNTIYTTPTGINSRVESLILTNTTSTSISIDIYYNDGSTDYLLDTITLPSGSGRSRGYWNIDKSNAGDVIKLQSDSTSAFNYFLNGSEVEI